MKIGHGFPTFLELLLIMWLILAESDILSDHADGLDQRMGEVCEQGKYRKYEKRRKKSAGNVILVVSMQPVPWYIKKQPANFNSGGYSETWLRALIAEA